MSEQKQTVCLPALAGAIIWLGASIISASIGSAVTVLPGNYVLSLVGLN